jgi:glutaredoxin 3
MQVKEIIIYSTPSCGYCKLLKSWLTENNIGYSDIDVAADINRRQEMIEKSGFMGVPVSRIIFDKDGSSREEVIIGFDKPRFSQLLGIK